MWEEKEGEGKRKGGEGRGGKEYGMIKEERKRWRSNYNKSK